MGVMQIIASVLLFFGAIVLFLEVFGVSLPKFDTLASFSLVYGGVWLLTGSWLLSVVLALVFAVFFHFVIYPYMLRSDTSASPSEKDMEGKRAEVITTIPEGGCGEIMVLGDISKLTFIAEGYEGQTIPSGEEVVIIEVVEGVAKVSEINKYL